MDVIKVRKKNHAFLHIDAEPGILNELTDFFCFYAEGYQFMPSYKNKMWDGKVRLFQSRERELPGGLYKYLYEFANVRDYKVEVEIDNYYGVPDGSMDINLDYLEDCTFTSRGEPIEHRDYQLNAIHHGLSNKRALLISPTASGKSFIIYSLVRYYLENHNKKILLVVPTTSLVKQMYSDFADYSEHDEGFDAGNLIHCIYGGQPKIPEKTVEYKIKLDNGLQLTLSDKDQVRLACGKRVFASKLTGNEEICDKWLATLKKS